ncbi:hypothetical protein [Demequina sp.]|uniref:hypothetical protein n=1 Tax=Demequina sp. TaxID=2050685 RepID=UPI0025C61AD7|nr:hypothetical protein [Demequina sp.]
MPLSEDETRSKLKDARAAYVGMISPHYDEVFNDVAERVRENGYATKLDLGGLVLWKRLQANTRWASSLGATADAKVRDVTGRALSVYRDEPLSDVPARAQAARSILAELPGFAHGDAFVSALLTAFDRDNLAVFDRRANYALETVLERPVRGGRGHYRRYIEEVHALRALVSEPNDTWTARDVDTALYMLGG